MAATPTKTPPSEKQHAKESRPMENVSKDKVAEGNHSTTDVPLNGRKQAPAAVACDALEPSYESSEQSEQYQIAKALLNEGDFEQALSMIEQGIEDTREVLSQHENGQSEDWLTLHPSMAPFHYLYGTTLLYSIEESPDSQGLTAEPPSEDQPDDEAADDVQIAFENLEAARIILEHMSTTAKTEKLLLDLAQVHLREGDLQKMNGRYEEAIADYQLSLEYLVKANTGPFNRKIADVHYNLALVYSLAVADHKESSEESKNEEQKIDLFRRKSFHHYLACGEAMVGQIAFLCHQDAQQFVEKAKLDIPKFKSTGEEESLDMEHPKMASLKLLSLRQHAQALAVPDEHADQVQGLMELLVEIQETVDESENSEKGVHEVSSMKAQITAAVAASDNEPTLNGFPAAETQLGFDAPSIDGAQTQVGTAAASAVPAQPIMIIKKKKRPADDAKMSANPAKQYKNK